VLNSDVVRALESLLAVVGVGEGIEAASNGCAADLKNIDWTSGLTPRGWVGGRVC
jgi:hypothetical protein